MQKEINTLKPSVKSTPLKNIRVNKSQESTSNKGIKYSDKSAGQPELIPIFNEIKRMLETYKTGNFTIREASGQALLISEKPVVVNSKKREEMWFASALIQKGYVGFYFMPVYGMKKVSDQIKPELMKCLRGKACFHIKKFDPILNNQIEEALKIGYSAYKEMGWI